MQWWDMGADDGVNDSWPLPDQGTIHGLIYDYQKSIEDLKHKHLYTTVELESLRTRTSLEMRRKEEEMQRAEEEIMRKEERIDELTRQLKTTTQERDEARYQLMLMNESLQPTKAVQLHPAGPLQPESPHFKPTRAGSGITESDSQSESRNNHGSYVSSPIESFTSPPDLSNMSMADSYNAAVPYHPLSPQCKSSAAVGVSDQGSVIIDCLAMRKGLPEKGKLLEAVQAVTRVTPLLETLLMTGPLPRWRNPPPLHVFHIPPVAVEGRGTGVLFNPAAVVNPNSLAQIGLQHEKSLVGSHVSDTPIDRCMARRGASSPRPIGGRSSTEKRQRPQ